MQVRISGYLLMILFIQLLQDPVANWVLVANILKSAQYITNLDVEVITFESELLPEKGTDTFHT